MAQVLKVSRDEVGRFESGVAEACCNCDDVGDFVGLASDWRSVVYGADEVLKEAEEVYEGQPEVVGFMQALRVKLREDARKLEQVEAELEARAFEDEADDAYVPAFLDSREVEILNVTGLEGREAQVLALKLSRWNPIAAHVYKWRRGKRYLHPGVNRVDLNDPFVQSLGSYDDLLAIKEELNLPVTREDVRLAVE